MNENRQLNADRFLGFANAYNEARPECPQYVIEIAEKYLGCRPDVVVDLGCGTGLSTFIWNGISNHTVGVEPSTDMIAYARKTAASSTAIEFVQGFSNDTKLEKEYADIVTCSQSFHWMEPKSTLSEVNRILKPNGIFLTYDCDWPPVCNWKAELMYQQLFQSVNGIEATNPDIKDTFNRWDKNNHLSNIKNSGYFKFVREIVFTNRENCTAERFIAIALSQGGLQTILKKHPDIILPQLNKFETQIKDIFKEEEFKIDFCYRMRIGIKSE